MPVFTGYGRISASHSTRFEGSLGPEIRVSQSKTASHQTGVPVVTFDALDAYGVHESALQIADQAAVAPTSPSGCSTHQQQQRIDRPVQLSRLDVDIASLTKRSSAGSLMNPVPSPAHFERFLSHAGLSVCCTPTSPSTETLHPLAEHHHQSALEPRYGVEHVAA